VTPFGIDLPEPADLSREQAATLLFVGNFTHPPNVDAARWLSREIMPLLRAQNSGARLLLVGGSTPEEVRALAGPGIEVVGEVPTVAPYFERAAVVLAPVRTGGGMRMKVLRALAGGKAVVTTPRGAEGFTIAGDSPPMVIAEDAEGIANATARLLADERQRRALARRARAFATEHYSAQAYGHRLELVYEELVAARRRLVTASPRRPAHRESVTGAGRSEDPPAP
jgi:glycosyltransferase involved in cell wall biosynthesis